jgi:molybdopterin synthase sulfur carrier subunit
MVVTVKLFATFRAGRFDVARLEQPAGATIADVVDGLRIPRNEIGIVLADGRHVDLARALSEGETLSIFPLVGGG